MMIIFPCEEHSEIYTYTILYLPKSPDILFFTHFYYLVFHVLFDFLESSNLRNRGFPPLRQ